MKLTPEQESRLDDWLDEKEIGGLCPFCNKGNFVRDKWQIIQVGSVVVTGIKGINTIALTCENCGHIALFSADMIGIGFNGK